MKDIRTQEYRYASVFVPMNRDYDATREYGNIRYMNPEQSKIYPQGIENLSPRDRKFIPKGSKIGFTLIEILIAVAILGILAAIIIPEFQGHIQQAKEAAAKETLRIYREVIEHYAFDHNGVAPGHFGNNPNLAPAGGIVKMQLVTEYFTSLPKNPFNDLASLLVLENAAAFPVAPSQTDTYGWIYKPATKTIKLNWSGTDSEGIEYFSY